MTPAAAVGTVMTMGMTMQQRLCILYETYLTPPRPERLPQGTWYKGFVFYSGNRRAAKFDNLPGDDSKREIPLEHIAAPSCRSLQGINGNVLSVEQMKNCRNVRYIVPKPQNWEAEESDTLFEQDSLFFLSGESNGSNLGAGNSFIPWRSFHPPRHGVHEIMTSWEHIDEGCEVRA